MKLISLLFLITIFISFHCYGVKTDKKEPCKTPDDKLGECIIIRNCPTLYALLKVRPIPVENTEFLNQSHCGFQGEIPKVCCPLDTLTLRSTAAIPDKNEPCKTPDKKLGECITIRNCPTLYALLKVRPIPVENTEFLKQSHCGFQGEIPKVCCPLDTLTMRSTTAIPDDDVLPPLQDGLLPSTSICGEYFGNRIFGGTEADLDESPWMALIIYKSPSGLQDYGCGGVLINERYVLTAAHCLKGKDFPGYWRLKSVRLGEYNKDSDEDCVDNGFTKTCLKTPPINVTVEERIAHEKYDPNDPDQKYDIALLRLSQKVKYTDHIKPICLPLLEEERRRNYTGLNMTVVGWGQTLNNPSSSIKMKLVVPVVSNSDCNYIYNVTNIEVTEKQICAGGQRNHDNCQGDSGGPLMYIGVDEKGDSNWYLSGIVSYSTVDCGVEDWPGVYTRVSKYMGWILRHMKP